MEEKSSLHFEFKNLCNICCIPGTRAQTDGLKCTHERVIRKTRSIYLLNDYFFAHAYFFVALSMLMYDTQEYVLSTENMLTSCYQDTPMYQSIDQGSYNIVHCSKPPVLQPRERAAYCHTQRYRRQILYLTTIAFGIKRNGGREHVKKPGVWVVKM